MRIKQKSAKKLQSSLEYCRDRAAITVLSPVGDFELGWAETEGLCCKM